MCVMYHLKWSLYIWCPPTYIKRGKKNMDPKSKVINNVCAPKERGVYTLKRNFSG